jgi:hypothetical protein
LQHIIAVELRYAERLSNERETPYEDIAKTSVDLLYESHDRAINKLRDIEGESEAFWSERILVYIDRKVVDYGHRAVFEYLLSRTPSGLNSAAAEAQAPSSIGTGRSGGSFVKSSCGSIAAPAAIADCFNQSLLEADAAAPP